MPILVKKAVDGITIAVIVLEPRMLATNGNAVFLDGFKS